MTAAPGRVLIVDDDAITRAIHRTVLAEKFDIETTGSGQEALEICREHLPDLILLDAMMPGIDGYETCRQLRQFTDIPIIFATSNETLDEHLKAFDAGGDDLIIKPVVREILLHKIALAIAQKNKQKNLINENGTLQNMAMGFLSAVGESGVLEKFMRSSMACSTSKALGESLVQAITDFGLECSVLIRTSQVSTVLNSRGEPSEMERMILEQSGSMGRIFQFGHRLVVNYERVSVIVNNLPMDDEGKSGRMRDNITTLAEMANTLCDNVDMRLASSSRAEQLQVALTTAVAAIDTLHERSHNAQVDIRILLQDLMEKIEKTYSWIGISRDQEERISKIMLSSVDKILSLLGTTGDQSDEQLDKVLSALKDGHVGGEVDLF